MKKRKRKQKQLSKRLFLIIEILCVLIFIYAVLQLVSIIQDYRRASKEYDHLAEVMVVTDDEKVSEQNSELENQQDESEKTNYYVDLDALKLQNPDTVGWIILPDSKINYPIVLSKDNEEYLTTTFEGQKSSSA